MIEMTDGTTLSALVAAFNAHDLDLIARFFTDDCVLEAPRGSEPWGTRGTLTRRSPAGTGRTLCRYPDVRYGDEEHWLYGDHAVSKWLLTGTTTAGEPIRVRGCDLFSSPRWPDSTEGLVLEDRHLTALAEEDVLNRTDRGCQIRAGVEKGIRPTNQHTAVDRGRARA